MGKIITYKDTLYIWWAKENILLTIKIGRKNDWYEFYAQAMATKTAEFWYRCHEFALRTEMLGRALKALADPERH